MSIDQERYNETRLAIFEAENDGVIDEDRKERLLESLNNVTESYNNDYISESEADELYQAIIDKTNGIDVYEESDYSDNIDDITYVSEAQYQKMRLDIFNDYELGEFDESVKDQLLERLNQKYEII